MIKPNKRLTVLALWAEKLHKQSICQLNHMLDYANGWFYYDSLTPFRDRELVREAGEKMKAGMTGAIRREGMRDVYFLTACRPAPNLRHKFTVRIEGCTADQALTVLRERLGHDEDLGFPYTIQF